LSDKPKLKVQIELEGIKHMAEGSVDEVIHEVIKFVSKIIPTYQVASKIMFTPDYTAILNDISSFINITEDGKILLLESSLSTDQAIGLTLLGAHLAYKIGKRESEEMSVEEISKSLNKAMKTVRNTLVQMVDANVIERVERGSYKITSSGIKEVHESILAFLEGKKKD
jgi:predicted transcriptional regulator